MIAFSEIGIGTGGIASCAACLHRSGGQESQPFSADAVKERLVASARSWSHGPGPNVSFIDFEPFAHLELPEIIRVATDLGYERVRLRTDAGALSMPGNAEGALGAGVRQLEVVMLADDDDHDRLTERPGLFAAAYAGVRAFLDAAQTANVPVAVTGLVPVCRHNAVLVPGAVVRLAELGVVAVHLDVSECTESERVFIVAALDTAAANAVAASVSGLPVEVPVPWAVRPWTVVDRVEV